MRSKASRIVNTDELASAVAAIGILGQLYMVNDTAEYAWCLVVEGNAWERANKGTRVTSCWAR